jgi:outer membrane immunogenic protein
MKRAWTLAIGVLASAATTLSASAADLGARPIGKAPAIAPVAAFSWTGCYIGVNGGWGFGDSDVLVASSADPVAVAFFTPALTAGALPRVFSLEKDGALFGGQIGCNWQSGAFVFGGEADFQWSDIKDAVAITTNVPGFVTGIHGVSQDLNWFGTVRGRIGWASDRVLFYATGGLAYGDVDYFGLFTFPATNDFQTVALSDTEFGWTVGAGIEWAFAPNWSIKAEYLYIDLGDRNIATVGSGRAPNPTVSLITNWENTYHIARGGVNFRF